MKKNECPKCVEKVNALIANKALPYTEEDRGALEVMEESLLDKLIPEDKPVKEKEVVANAAPETPKPLTEKEHYAGLGIDNPAEFKAQAEFGLAIYKSERAKVEKLILDNTVEGVWTPEALKDMKIETLQSLAKSIVPKETDLKIDYSILGKLQEVVVNTTEEVPHMMPVNAKLVVSKEKKGKEE